MGIKSKRDGLDVGKVILGFFSVIFLIDLLSNESNSTKFKKQLDSKPGQDQDKQNIESDWSNVGSYYRNSYSSFINGRS